MKYNLGSSESVQQLIALTALAINQNLVHSYHIWWFTPAYTLVGKGFIPSLSSMGSCTQIHTHTEIHTY